MELDSLFPTLFGKTFFVLSLQLFITWLTTRLAFSFFTREDPESDKKHPSPLHELRKLNPDHTWLLTGKFYTRLLIADFIVFLVLLFWGVKQPLPESLGLFTLWSVITGLELEFILLFIDHGLGQKALALTATIVLTTGLVGMHADINFSFLSGPLFIALIALIILQVFQIGKAMSTAKQRLIAAFGVLVFTLYLVLDFNWLTRKQAAGTNSWTDAMGFAVKIYLDIINLFIELLDLLMKSSQH
jgi:FtsH-binding integral membrane protein